jgi:hypothetical protein
MVILCVTLLLCGSYVYKVNKIGVKSSLEYGIVLVFKGEKGVRVKFVPK